MHDFDRSSAIVIRAGRETWLLGCGHGSDFERGLRPALYARGLDKVSGLVVAEGTSAHLGAIDEFLRQFPPDRVVESPLAARLPDRQRLHQTLADAKQGKSIHWHGQSIPLGASGIELRVLHPPAGLERRVSDDQALVLRLQLPDGRRVLFMADSGFNTERWLIENEADLASDVLVLGRHSRDLTGTPEFLRRVAPKWIVRHEHSRRFRKPDENFQLPAGIPFWQTSEEGAIVLRFFPNRSDIRGFVSGRSQTITR